jgi:hypothetical protein
MVMVARNWLTLRRLAGVVATTAVVTTTAIAARHDPDAAATTVDPVAETAWVPNGQAGVLLADARYSRALATVSTAAPTAVAQVGDAAVVVSDLGVAVVSGRDWSVRDLPGPPPAQPFIAAGPDTAWLLSPSGDVARRLVAADDGVTGRGNGGGSGVTRMVDVAVPPGLTSRHVRVDDDGTLWILARDGLRGVVPGQPDRVVPLEPTHGDRVLTIVDGDPVVIEARRARRLDPARLAFAADWPLDLPDGPITPAERSTGVAVARTATVLATTRPGDAGPSVAIPFGFGTGDVPVERDGLVYVTDQSAHQVDVVDPRRAAGQQLIRRIAVPGRGALTLIGHHHRVWFTAALADERGYRGGVITDDLTARAVTGPADDRAAGRTNGDEVAGWVNDGPGPDRPETPPDQRTPTLDLGDQSCPRNWPAARCPTDSARPEPGSSGVDPSSLACPRTWADGSCQVTGTGEAGSDTNSTGPSDGNGGPGAGTGTPVPPTTSPARPDGLPDVRGLRPDEGAAVLKARGLRIGNQREVPSLQPRGTIEAVWHGDHRLEPGEPIDPTWVEVNLDISDGSKPIVQVATSSDPYSRGDTVCVLTADGLVACFGANSIEGTPTGILGVDGPDLGSATPVYVRGVNDATAIAVGTYHACALLKTDHRVVCWGLDGATATGPTPVTVNLPRTIVEIAIPDHFLGTPRTTCAREQNGEVWCWGDQAIINNGPPSESTFTASITPVRVPYFRGATDIDGDCAVRAGTVRCAGLDSYWLLGTQANDDAYHTDENVWDPATGADLRGATAVDTGSWGSCALSIGGVSCWGHLGEGPDQFPGALMLGPPKHIAGTEGATKISVSAVNRCAVMSDFTVRCWGAQVPGIELVDPDGFSYRDVAQTIQGVSSAQQVSTGDSHVCVIDAIAALRCWGSLPTGDPQAQHIVPEPTQIRIEPRS